MKQGEAPVWRFLCDVVIDRFPTPTNNRENSNAVQPVRACDIMGQSPLKKAAYATFLICYNARRKAVVFRRAFAIQQVRRVT